MIGKSQAQVDQVSAETEPLLKDRYRRCYDKIASDRDLVQPLESGKDARNLPLLSWIGDARGKRVLDVGSAQGLLLDSLGRAKARVCADLARPYRVARAKASLRCSRQEHLPFEPAVFDVVVCTGVLGMCWIRLPWCRRSGGYWRRAAASCCGALGGRYHQVWQGSRCL
ncbi:MAG: methyltransferase domain-containing protein [Nitrospiraceae bacterium]